MLNKKTFFTVWDGEKFCGAFATRAEAVDARADMCDPGCNFPNRICIFKEVAPLSRLEAVCDEDCSELWAKCD